jgi:predicted nucleic acid-binding protein
VPPLVEGCLFKYGIVTTGGRQQRFITAIQLVLCQLVVGEFLYGASRKSDQRNEKARYDMFDFHNMT